MSTKLYYASPYTTEWETKIKKVVERDDEYFVILEETAFYPHGGGQPCDKGSMNGIAVLDVFMEDHEVFHKVEHLPDTSIVNCKLDWRRRFDHMQHHSGQHLLSAVCLELFQARTVSFHLGIDDVTIDVDQPEWTETQLLAIEQEVNKQIYQNRNIHSYFVTNKQLKEIPVVKMPKVTENIRIVEIEGMEYNACGGTHVSRTGEIGMIKLFKAEKLKGATRIHFKCGYRALEDFNESLKIIGTLSEKFNTGRRDILDRIEKWEQDQKQLQSHLEVLMEQNDSYLAKEMLSKIEGNLLAHIFEDKSFKDMQHLATKLALEHDLIILFATTAENKVVLVHNGTQTFSCGKFLKEYLGTFNGKGGGRDQSAQAGFSSSEDTLGFFHFAREHMKMNATL
jgi:alanyl-tRNA synthetase